MNGMKFVKLNLNHQFIIKFIISLLLYTKDNSSNPHKNFKPLPFGTEKSKRLMVARF